MPGVFVPALVYSRAFAKPGKTDICISITQIKLSKLHFFVFCVRMKTSQMNNNSFPKTRYVLERLSGGFLTFKTPFIHFNPAVGKTFNSLFFFSTFDSFVSISPDKWMETVCKYLKKRVRPIF